MDFVSMHTADRKNSEKDLLITIGENIRLYRRRKGMSQENLAHAADVDRTYLGYVENGKHNVSVLLLLKLANALEIEVAALLIQAQ